MIIRSLVPASGGAYLALPGAFFILYFGFFAVLEFTFYRVITLIERFKSPGNANYKIASKWHKLPPYLHGAPLLANIYAYGTMPKINLKTGKIDQILIRIPKDIMNFSRWSPLKTPTLFL